jgi:hypothetical protein
MGRALASCFPRARQVAFWRNRENRVRVGLRFYVFVAEGLSRVSLLIGVCQAADQDPARRCRVIVPSLPRIANVRGYAFAP